MKHGRDKETYRDNGLAVCLLVAIKGANRPDPGRDGVPLYRKGGRPVEGTGTGDADADHPDIQRKFNDYLDSFRDIISYAAQIYGFYHEVGKLAENIGSLNDQLRSHAGNAIAVALTPNRNRIYQELILGSVEIVNDIRQVCLSDNKMTEKQRIELVFGIRPKLKAMNKKLRHLTLAVKYTSLADVWATIDEGARPQKADKAEIARAAMRRWRRNGDL